MLSKCTLNGTFVQTLHWISKHRAVPFLISCSLMWKCNSAREIVNYGRHSTPVGNLWKLFRNSKLFWLTAHSDRAYMESVGHYYFWCDHWPWSGSLCGVGPILSLVFQGKSKKWRIQRLHYPLRAGAAGVFFFFFFLSKCSAYYWIEIHVSQFRYDNPRYLAFNSHLFLPNNSSLPPPSSLVLPPHFHSHSIITHLFFTLCVISLLPPSPPAASTKLILYFFSPSPSPPAPPSLHLSARAQRETVGTSRSRILISHFVV